MQHVSHRHSDEIARLNQRIAEMRAALEPLARRAGDLAILPGFATVTIEITVAEIRRAKLAADQQQWLEESYDIR